MKFLFLILLFFVNMLASYSQINFVPNPSFEIFDTCPNSVNQLNYTKYWFSTSSSPDYFNACSPAGNMSVPENIYGFQYAADSNGYCGIVTYGRNDSSYWNTRESVGIGLLTPLTIGQKYYVSFKTNFTLNDFETGIAVNKLGALFSTIPFNKYDSMTTPPINNFAHISSNLIISDTANWNIVLGSFTADSAYKYITIGNFFENKNVDTIIFNNDSLLGCCSYYYIDDVRVSTDSNFVMNTIASTAIPFDKYSKIFPNPAKNIINLQNELLNEKNIKIKIYNFAGILMREYNLRLPYSINTSDINHGLYFINIYYENTIITHKLIIE